MYKENPNLKFLTDKEHTQENTRIIIKANHTSNKNKETEPGV